MNSASNEFKDVLEDLYLDELLNFIWLYDQYILRVSEMRIEKEEYDISPLNIEEFYNLVYSVQF